MKIVDVRATPVYVELEAPLLWSMGVEHGTTRTVIELITDEGIVGLGETYGGASIVKRIDAARPLFIGMDPFEVATIVQRFEVFRVTSEQMAQAAEMKYVGAGIEMACWDAVGKALGKPLYRLWGGAGDTFVPFVAYVFYRRERNGVGGEATPDAIVERYGAMVERYGFQGIKFKGGVYDPEQELAAVRALREAYGDQIRFMRFDPNQAWTVETSIRYLIKMEPYDLEYVEDPTWDLEGMSLVRQRVRIPLATNQAVISFPQIAPAVRMGAIDVLLCDLYFWGGVSQAKKVAAICETFNIGLAIHSDRDLGIGTAAALHFWASTPMMSHSYDSHYHDQVGDVITEPFVFKDGGLRAPEGPGLGVELDPDRLAYHARLYDERGDDIEFFDPQQRSGWTPHLPLW
ncbi:MAG TPA: enolase C-terminal domain-like protein [Thermomicrobiales bacterium]|nr:enolase C-terminal domain-like protein [Thermomicrobiales bacterium]